MSLLSTVWGATSSVASSLGTAAYTAGTYTYNTAYWVGSAAYRALRGGEEAGAADVEAPPPPPPRPRVVVRVPNYGAAAIAPPRPVAARPAPPPRREPERAVAPPARRAASPSFCAQLKENCSPLTQECSEVLHIIALAVLGGAGGTFLVEGLIEEHRVEKIVGGSLLGVAACVALNLWRIKKPVRDDRRIEDETEGCLTECGSCVNQTTIEYPLISAIVGSVGFSAIMGVGLWLLISGAIDGSTHGFSVGNYAGTIGGGLITAICLGVIGKLIVSTPGGGSGSFTTRQYRERQDGERHNQLVRQNFDMRQSAITFASRHGFGKRQ